MSEVYRVTIAATAQKFIDKKAPRHMRVRLLQACEALGKEPRPPGCIMMAGEHNRWRIREGDYRIQYAIYDKDLWVEVVDVDHRKDAYR